MADNCTVRAYDHAPFSLSHGLSSDIFPGLFEWFFTHPTFERWSQNRVKWHLHCIGGPGTGKTTLAGLVATRLQTSLRPHAHTIAFYLTRDTMTLEPEFIEDFLLALYNSLGEWETCQDDGTDEDYEEYYHARFDKPGGSRVQLRLALIRRTLHNRLRLLEEDDQVFLIVDGIDRCSRGLSLLLDGEILALQDFPVNVMITSRIATYEHREVQCDHRAHEEVLAGEPPSLDESSEAYDSAGEEYNTDEELIDYSARERLDLFFKCRTCEDIMCFPCFDAGHICGNCLNNDALFEAYDHVNVAVDTNEDAMKNFIAWDLEREHGDLGLNSAAKKPPLSKLGWSFCGDYPGSAQSIADDIRGRALGHIGLAKARLDLVHEAQSVEELMQHRYQLPNNIVTLYQAAIAAVGSQDPIRRELGLKAIAAAGQDFDGLPVPDMLELMHNSIAVKPRSGEDAANAARGFLHVTPFDKPQMLVCFHETFYFFVSQRYSETLYNVSQSLLQDSPESEQPSGVQPASFFTSPRLQFEPMHLPSEPKKVTSEKIKRTVTMAQIPEEAPSRTYVVRQGTRAWR